MRRAGQPGRSPTPLSRPCDVARGPRSSIGASGWRARGAGRREGRHGGQRDQAAVIDIRELAGRAVGLADRGSKDVMHRQ
jgi:hypothetical protein